MEQYLTFGMVLSSKSFQERLLFKEGTDLRFFCSSDRVRLFKSRTTFAISPIMLFNLNLPPDERVKLKNVILCGFVPGPKNLQDLDSYMHPLVQEFTSSEQGW